MLIRLGLLIGVALLVMALNIAGTVVYMVIYSYLINPGHPAERYQQHVQVAAPYCSIVAGIPLMFLAGYWVAGWTGPLDGIKAALVVWLTYALIDVVVSLMAGLTPRMALLVTISLVTKLAAALLGALASGRVAG